MHNQWFFRKLIPFVLILTFGNYVFAATDAITKITATTLPQTISEGAVSGAITLQAQNSSGSAEKVSETTDISMTSSSATGEFSSNSSNWKAVNTVVMSTNSANRTVYYKDSTTGTHTLTFIATGRTSGKSWTTSGTITVGSASMGTSTTTASTETETYNGTTGSDSAPSFSSHSSGEELSSGKITKEIFEINAGRKRIGYVGTPLKFEAKGEVVPEASIRYVWSFGDGMMTEGQFTSHAYMFPGEYNVVLNGFSRGKNAVSRTTVKIFAPEVSISKNETDFIEIRNSGQNEINLNEWYLKQSGNIFTFPLDTIIAPGSYVRIPRSITRLSNIYDAVTLHAPTNSVFSRKEAGGVQSAALASVDNQEFTISREEFQAIKARLIAYSQATVRSSSSVKPEAINTSEATIEATIKETSTQLAQSIASSTNAAQVFKSDEDSKFVRWVKNLVKR